MVEFVSQTHGDGHNTLDFLDPEHPSPRLLEVGAKGKADVTPQLSVVDSMRLVPEWLRVPRVG